MAPKCASEQCNWMCSTLHLRKPFLGVCLPLSELVMQPTERPASELRLCRIPQEFALELSFPDARATAGLQRVMAKFRPAANETLADGMPAIGIPGFVEKLGEVFDARHRPLHAEC